MCRTVYVIVCKYNYVVHVLSVPNYSIKSVPLCGCCCCPIITRISQPMLSHLSAVRNRVCNTLIAYMYILLLCTPQNENKKPLTRIHYQQF